MRPKGPSLSQHTDLQGQDLSEPTGKPADSVGHWFLAILLMSIPVINVLYLLALASGGSASQARCNWARAILLWILVSIVIWGIIVVTGEQGSLPRVVPASWEG